MEAPNSFNLNHAIRQWRQRFAGSSALNRQDLDELEAHLRDSVQALAERGLNMADAFEVAAHRLGANPELSAEFAKVNAHRIWLERALWMLCGFLIAKQLLAIAQAGADVVFNLTLRLGISALPVISLSWLTKCLSIGVLIALGMRGLTRFSRPVWHLAQTCLRHPVRTGIVLILGLGLSQKAPGFVVRGLAPIWDHLLRPGWQGPTEPFTALDQGLVWSWILFQLCCVVSVPLFAGYLWRKSRLPQPKSPMIPVRELGSAERAAVESLSQHGLTESEAILLRSRRQHREAGWTGENQNLDPLQFARAFWMLLGGVLGCVVVPLLLAPSALLLVICNGPLPVLMQHVAGFGSVCLGLATMAGVGMAMFKGSIRYSRQMQGIGRMCGNHPAWSAALLAALCLSVGGGVYFTAHRWAGTLPAQVRLGDIATGWLHGGDLLFQLILPVVLLVWLARKRELNLPDPA